MVGGRLSASSQFTHSHSTQDKFFYTSHMVSCRYYSLRVKDHPTLTKDFRDSIWSLPQSYNSQTKAAFEQFISVYGTHYLHQVDLGGRVHSTTATCTCQVAMKNLTVREIRICLSLEVSVNIQGVDDKSQKEFCRKMGKKLETGHLRGSSDQNYGWHRRGHLNINLNCCPTHPGVAELTVKLERTTRLWGDYVSKNDGYVKIFYGAKSKMIPIIWNNNFPVWNYVARCEIMDLTKKWKIKLEVWDRDNIWDDDLLRKAFVLPVRGTNVRKQFSLKHGMLYVSISVVCGSSLEGSSCKTYIPTPDCERIVSYSELLQFRTSFLQENYDAQGKSSVLQRGKPA